MNSDLVNESVFFSNEYFELVNAAYCNNHLIYITTITWLFKINHSTIDITKLYEKFNVENVFINDMKKNFNNQLTIKFTNFSTKSIKIFKNGIVQIAGLSSFFECVQVSKMIIEWLNEFIPFVDKKITYDMIPNSHKIVMINLSANTYVDSFINLKYLTQKLKHEPYVLRANYAPENHRGINVKFKTGVSMFIFHTGKIIMTHSSLKNLRDAYINVSHFFKNDGSSSTRRSICKTNIDTVSYGYDIRDIMGLVTLTKTI